jgi:hypothetical protein
MKKYLALIALPFWAFLLVFAGRAVLEFAFDHRSEWWGGMPLWAMGFVTLAAIGVGLPMSLAFRFLDD